MKMSRLIFGLLVIRVFFSPPASSAVTTLSQLDTNVGNLMDEYFDLTTILPVQTIGTTLPVTVDLTLVSVSNVDEQEGSVDMSGFLSISWTEERATRTADDLFVLLPVSGMWTPPLTLLNSQQAFKFVDANPEVRFNFKTALSLWQPRFSVKSSCILDITFYPFDSQVCSLKFSAWGYTSSEVLLSTASSTVDLQSYQGTTEWSIRSTSTSSRAFVEDSVSYVEFRVELKRKANYYIINIILPIVLLSTINIFVFAIPASTPDRIVFSALCCLAYLVVVDMATSLLPKPTSSIPYLYYYIFSMMVFSFLIILATVLTVWLHAKPDQDGGPRWLNPSPGSHVTSMPRTTVEPLGPGNPASVWEEEAQQEEEEEEGPSKSPWRGSQSTAVARGSIALTWRRIASGLDVVFFISFLVAEVCFSTAFLVLLRENVEV